MDCCLLWEIRYTLTVKDNQELLWRWVWLFTTRSQLPSGVVNNVVYGGASPWGLTPYPFIYHFWQERHPFLIPSIDKWYPLRVEPSRLGHYRENHLGNILTTFAVNINYLSSSFSTRSLFITTRNILREWICLWKVHDITDVLFFYSFSCDPFLWWMIECAKPLVTHFTKNSWYVLKIWKARPYIACSRCSDSGGGAKKSV